MRRVYKEDSPKNTVLRIKKILSEIGVVTFESFLAHPHTNIFSCRTELIPSLGNFGQNGKGTTVEYALASSHAEFMERLQNGLLFGISHLSLPIIKKIRDDEGFVYYPDEHVMDMAEFMRLPVEYLCDVFGDVTTDEVEKEVSSYYDEARRNGFDGIISVPFYDCSNNKIVYLPYNLTQMITGSNGMSAGNSENEGVFQALCEIIERAAASTVYNQNLTPPTVLDEYLKRNSALYNIIKEIESQGYVVVVKDFSAGYKLPVVGTLIVDQKKHKYRLNVGSDTCFDIALSRTLTEIHQGLSDKKDLENIMLPIPQNYVAHNSFDKFEVDENLEKFFENGTGVFTSAIFKDVESYPFEESTFCDSQNYNEGCKYLIKKLESLGSKVFVRDTSFLGFPSFYVYVTKLSSFRNKGITDFASKTFDIRSNINYGQIEKHINEFRNVFDDNDSMAFFVEKFPVEVLNKNDILMCRLMKIEISKNHYWSSIPMSYFLTIFCFVLGDYEKAIDYLHVYLKTMGLEKSSYYRNVLKYFKFLSSGKPKDYIYKHIAAELIDNFSVGKIKSKLEFPMCPNCSNCPIVDACETHTKINIFSSMQRKMICNTIDQMKFSELFN